MATLTAAYLDDNLGRVQLDAAELLPEVVYSIQRSDDGGTTWATVRGATNIVSGGVTRVYDYEYTPGVLNDYRLVQPLVSDTFEREQPTGTVLQLPGDGGDYASTPDASVLDVTNELELRIAMALDDYTPDTTTYLVGKYEFNANQRSYMLRINGGNNHLVMVLSSNGTSAAEANSGAPVPATDGAFIALRTLTSVNNTTGDWSVSFQQAPDIDAPESDWVTFASDTGTLSGTSLFNGTAPLTVGAAGNGTGTARGDIMAARVYSGGTLVAAPDFTQQTPGTTAFTDMAGRPWTVHGNAAIVSGTEPLPAAAADRNLAGSDPALAPSVGAGEAGLLIAAWTDYTWNGTYTLDGSMVPVVQQNGVSYGPSAVATQSVSAGATGTRSATAGTAAAWSTASVVMPGTVTIDDAQWGTEAHGLDPITVNLAAAEVGDWLIAVHAAGWDGSDNMTAPAGSGWELVTDSGVQSASRTRIWAKQVDTAGPQSVTSGTAETGVDHFLTVLLLSGVTGSPAGWGNADTGQAWNLYANSGTDGTWFVADGAGQFTGGAGAAFGYGRYIDGPFTDVEVVYDLIMSGAGAQWRLALRGTDDSFTGFEVIVTADASGDLELAEFTGDGPATDIIAGTWQIGQRWRVRARLVGTTLETRAWNTANPEPSTWQLTTTSTSWTSGTIGINFNPVGTMMVDNFLVSGVPPLAAATASVFIEQGDVFLKSIQFPSLNRNLGCIFTGERSRRSRVGLFDVKGRHAVLAVFDVGSTETMSIRFITTSVEANKAVTALLTWGGPLLLQSPPDEVDDGCGDIAAYPSGWFAPGDSTQVRPLTGRRGWEWTVPLTRIAVPSVTDIIPAHMTWEVLWQITANWVELWDTWATWADMWDSSVAPGTMIEALNE